MTVFTTHICSSGVSRFKRLKGKNYKVDRRRVITSHRSSIILGLLKILLGQLQVKVEADLFLLQLSKPGPELTRFLRTANKTHQSTETKFNLSIKCSNTTAESKHSIVVSGTTPSGCTWRAPTGPVYHPAWSSQREYAKKRDRFSDPGRLPAVDCGLGDYTQWVHSACPHWSGTHSDQTIRRVKEQ